MSAFLGEDFLLATETARRLYREHAAKQSILDYHTHLSAVDIAANRSFADLYEIWLEGDHYKWRAMRANGVAERYCTGDASPYEKFLAWARTVPHTLCNPLYHWTHLELQRYFGITELLDENTAPHIWERANGILRKDLTARDILSKFRVKVLCTTDDPTDSLAAHRALAETDLEIQVLPTFRPDQALRINQPAWFRPWLEKLAERSQIDIGNFPAFLDALRQRHDFFHAHGCRLSDHGLNRCYASPCSESAADKIFTKALTGKTITREEQEQFASLLMLFFGHLDSDRGWTKQLHLGARRNVNSGALHTLGPDTGYDSIGDDLQGAALAGYLDTLQRENALPQMILYNSNPRDSYLFATIAGSFQEGVTPGKIQFGSAWWFLDQKDGITAHLGALSNVGLLSRFAGMTTDSRSFMSFPRHEYFRRVLCSLIGHDVERGELPNDGALLGRLVEDLCYGNALRYFRLPLPDEVRRGLPGSSAKSRGA